MEPAQWIDLVVSLSFGAVFIMFFRLFIYRRSVLDVYFSLAALAITIPYALDLFKVDLPINLLAWGKLISITIYISGLLVIIRRSKPVFARFPIYLTALPFISFLFFPLIINSMIIKDLINVIYQGGALIVTILVFTVNQVKAQNRRYYIIGLSMIGTSYLGYWLYLNRLNITHLYWLPEILLSVGIIIASLRFFKGEQIKS